MSNSYTITNAAYADNTSNPDAKVLIVGTVNSINVFCVVFASAITGLSQAEQELYLAPIMLAASENIYGPTITNPNINSATPITLPSFYTAFEGLPSSWTA